MCGLITVKDKTTNSETVVCIYIIGHATVYLVGELLEPPTFDVYQINST